MNSFKTFNFRIVLTSFVFLISIVLIGFLLTKYSDTLTVYIDCQTRNIEDTCITEYIDENIQENPKIISDFMYDTSVLRYYNYLFGDMRSLSEQLHFLGYSLYNIGYSPLEAFNLCPNIIKDGCIHGYVMQDIHISNIPIDELENYCEGYSDDIRIYLNCYHAVGHSFAELSDGELFDDISINPCGNDELPKSACLSGIFHEYTKGGESMGHINNYDRVTYSNSPDCSTIPKDEAKLCSAIIGSFSQYYPNQMTLNSTFALCESTPSEYLCKKFALERIFIKNSRNLRSTYLECNTLLSEANRAECREIMRNEKFYPEILYQ